MSMISDGNFMWDSVALVKFELRQACALQVSLSCRIDVAATSGQAGVLLDPPHRVILNVMAVVNTQLNFEE